ncbi:hypothetical protein H0N99_02410 [Candidatus Micrarchaeota archaeon]|nr:hypothetical protein [Candidatus Micrarchaeota archaeon]
MSPQQALLEPPEKVTESQNKFAELYKTMSSTNRELGPLEKKILEFEEKLKGGRISRSEAEDLKKKMDRVLVLYDELEKTSKGIHELRKQLPPSEGVQGELKAVDNTIAEVYSGWTKAAVEKDRLKESLGRTSDEKERKRIEAEVEKLGESQEGLIFAEQKLREFKEGREADKNAELSKLKLG